MKRVTHASSAPLLDVLEGVLQVRWLPRLISSRAPDWPEF